MKKTLKTKGFRTRLPFPGLLAFVVLLQCTDSSKFRKEYELAVSAYSSNDIATAVEKLSELYRKQPDFRQTRLYYGRALFYNREYTAAAEVFEEAYDENPDSADARFWLAKTLARNEETRDESLEHLTELLRLNAGHIEARYLLGTIYEQRQEIDRAINAYRTATHQSKQLALVHLRLGILYSQAKLDDQARLEYERARLLAAGDSSILRLIAEAKSDRSRQASNQTMRLP